jgi:lysophospholipase L1-like esterase
MRHILTAILICSLPIAAHAQQDIGKLDKNMAIKTVDANGIAWYTPTAAPFRLVGFKWYEQDKLFRRLPVKPKWAIRKPVDHLANNTSGGQVHFQTDSARILVRVKLAHASGMYHMPATGQSGFDLYVGAPGELRYYKTARFNHGVNEYTAALLEGKKAMRNCVINFPLYNGVKSVEIGVDDGSKVEAAPAFAGDGCVVVYGTSITQGGCADRPGLSYTNILSRRLNREVVNLGFSGNGKGEAALAHLITQIPKKQLIVLDYEANAYWGVKETMDPFIDILREAQPNVPILVLTKIHYANELHEEGRMADLKKRAAFQRELVERRRAAGDSNIHFLDGGTLLGDHAEECTVDGVHPNALGFMKMADALEPEFRRLLKK